MKTSFIWDLDGVITDTSSLHKDSWIETLKSHVKDESESKITEKYEQFFSGVPRIVGIKRFLESTISNKEYIQDIEGLAQSIADYKNRLFRSKISNLDITIYNDALSFLQWSKQRGLRNGLASQSENADFVLDKSNIRRYLDSAATGLTAKEFSVKPKPNPDFYRHAAHLLGVKISNCVVFEDTYAGAFSAISAGAKQCVGVARSQSSIMELASAGCDLITRDLNQIINLIEID